jgi:hypothetical protein
MGSLTLNEKLQIQESLTHPVKNQETPLILKASIFNNIKLQVPQPLVIHFPIGHIPASHFLSQTIVILLTAISVIPILKTIKNTLI